MRLRPRASALFGLIVLGCTPSSSLPLPEVEDGRSMILISGAGRLASAFAFDLSVRDNALPIVVPAGQTRPLTALAYRTPLSSFDLEPGPIAVVTDDSGAPFPVPDETFVTELAAGKAPPSWRPGDGDDYASIEVQLPQQGPCARFEIDVLPVGSADDTIFAFPIDDERALLSSRSSVFLANETETTLLRTEPPGFEMTAGFVEDSGQIWLGTRGAIHRATLVGNTLLRTSPAISIGEADDPVVSIRGGPSPNGLELFSIVRSGRIYRWVSTSTEAEQIFDFSTDDETSNAELVWRGPGEIFAVSSLASNLIHIDGSLVAELTPLPLNRGGPSCMAERADGELLIGSLFGEVGAYLDGEWQDRSPDASLRIRAILPIADRYFWVGGGGLFGEVLDDFGACPTQASLGISHHHLFPIGERMMAVPTIIGYGVSLIRPVYP